MKALLAILFLTATAHAATPLTVAYHDYVPESVALKTQWERQYDPSPKAIVWCHRLEKEYTYLLRHFDVRFVEARELPSLPHYPSYRIGGSNWRRLKPVVGAPGCGIIALYEIGWSYQEPLESLERRDRHWGQCNADFKLHGGSYQENCVEHAFGVRHYCDKAPKLAEPLDVSMWEGRW